MLLDDEWTNFLNSDNIDHIQFNNNKQDEYIPKCSDIYISTKTKIVYLDTEFDIYDIFWKIKINDYDLPIEGIIKKQIKISCIDKSEVEKINLLLNNEKLIDVKVITEIDNPNGRIKFKNVRKISIGLCKKDLLYTKTKSKSAFYNCFVVSLRIKYLNVFKEIHVKIFNTGKLEIPGIQNDNILEIIINKIILILSDIINKTINYNKISENILINSNFNCGFYINRDSLFNILRYKYNVNTNYDPCSYPGIQCIYTYNDTNETFKISYMIFRTGSVLIVGKCNEEILNKCYLFIKNILEIEYKNIYISGNINKEKETNNLNVKLRKKIIYIS